MNFLNFWPWKPNGYVSDSDEKAIAGAAQRTLGAWQRHWELHAALHTIADEHFCPNSYQYIPTESQVIAANAALQMQLVSEHSPTQALNTPAGMRLVQAMYNQANALWQELARLSEMGR